MLDTRTRDVLDVATPGFQYGLTLNLLRQRGSLKTLEEVDAEVFDIHFKCSSGSMSETARTMKVGRSTLYRWVEDARPLPAHIG